LVASDSHPIFSLALYRALLTSSVTSPSNVLKKNISLLYFVVSNMTIQDILQIAHQGTKSRSAPVPKSSFLVGETQTPLWNTTLTQLFQQQVRLNPSRECIIFPEYRYRATYSDLYKTTLDVARSLRTVGVGRGDRVGIFAGNIPSYVELFFAVSHVGATFVVFNTTYTPKELQFALQHSGK